MQKNNYEAINEVLHIFSRNKIVLIVEISILFFSGIFALIVAIILSSGWGSDM